MYHYTIQVLAVDFPGQVDDLMLPIMAWVWQHQPDLLLNPDNNRKLSLTPTLSAMTWPILFKVPVWERVMVENVNGKPVATHLAEDRPRINGGEWEVVFDPG
jgi:hypothetical protein